MTQYHKCTDLDDLLYVETVLEHKTATDSVVVMRFCANYDIDAVEYRVQFNEMRPLFTEPYNQYTMALNTDNKTESVTVPLTSSDQTINIVVNGNIKPVEIRSQGIASVSRMQEVIDNEHIKVFDGAISVIVAIVVVCILLFAILCMQKC